MATALDQGHGAQDTTTVTMTTMVLEVEAAPEAGEVCSYPPFKLKDLCTNISQARTDLAHGEQAATVRGAIGLPSLTGAQVHGQGGGVAARAHLQTGQAGLLDRGALLRRGRHGQDAQLARQLQA